MAWFFRHTSCDRERRQLADRLDTVEAQLRLVRGEWVDHLDKMQAMVERWVKRVERSDKAAAPPVGGNGGAPREGPDEISARILARRSQHGVRP